MLLLLMKFLRNPRTSSPLESALVAEHFVSDRICPRPSSTLLNSARQPPLSLVSFGLIANFHRQSQQIQLNLHYKFSFSLLPSLDRSVFLRRAPREGIGRREEDKEVAAAPRSLSGKTMTSSAFTSTGKQLAEPGASDDYFYGQRKENIVRNTQEARLKWKDTGSEPLAQNEVKEFSGQRGRGGAATAEKNGRGDSFNSLRLFRGTSIFRKSTKYSILLNFFFFFTSSSSQKRSVILQYP